ncbi:MAG: hypothetical protein ACOC0R_06505 [Mariniphaga sp.]
MLKLSNVFGLLFIGLCLIAFTGCGSGQQKNSDTGADSIDPAVLETYHQEQQELLKKANAQMSELNKKILELNDKIKSGEAKLTDEQNQLIDSFEKKRASMNQRRHQIKNVSYNDWEPFKNKFEADLEDCCADIDKLLAEL